MPGDERLVARVADGDEEALRELLQRYQQPLSHFLCRYTGSNDVDDLFQETWLRVVKHARRFDSTKRFSTWMFQIAVNLCRDRHRRRTPEAEFDFDDQPAARSEVAAVEAAHDARALLALLPPNQREVVILRFYHDLGEQEVADILDCPRGTVKSRLHHALARMAAAHRKS